MTLASQPPTFVYHSFILRIWHEREAGRWRAVVQHVQSGNKRLFTTPDQLCLYLLALEEES